MDRDTLKKDLKEFLSHIEYPTFLLAKMTHVTFGIVDRDRADFLGLSFNVDILGYSSGASLHLPEKESLDIIRYFGDASKLENKICWVHVESGGSGFVRFVCFEGYEYSEMTKNKS